MMQAAVSGVILGAWDAKPVRLPVKNNDFTDHKSYARPPAAIRRQLCIIAHAQIAPQIVYTQGSLLLDHLPTGDQRKDEQGFRRW